MSRLPVLTPRKIIAALERAGFQLVRSSGSHRLYRHRDDPTREATVAYHGRDLAPKTLRSILRQARLSVDQLRDLL